MKKSYLLFFVLCLGGCAGVDKSIDVVHPNEYGLPDDLNGKVFSISCEGNDEADFKFVDAKCKEYMSEFAYKKGYDLFSVIGQDSGTTTSIGTYTINEPVNSYSNMSMYSGFTSYVPQTHHYTITKHAKGYLFVLVDKKEKDKWQNYYKVADYYTGDKINQKD